MTPKSEGNGVHVNETIGMPAAAEELAGGSSAPKFDQIELVVIRNNNRPPKYISDSPIQGVSLPTTDQGPKEDNLAAVPTTLVPPPAASPMTLPAGMAPAALGDSHLSKDSVSQYAAYQSAALEIQSLLSSIHARQDNITIEDLDAVHRTFDLFMSSHPVLSKEFNGAKAAQEAAMRDLPTMAPAPDPASLSLEELLIMPANLPHAQDSWSLPGGSFLDPFVQGTDAAAGYGGRGNAAMGSASLIQDVAAAYFSHMSQSSQTDPAEDLYINSLRCHLLDNANIDSTAVQVLQQLSADATGGGTGGGSGGSGTGADRRGAAADEVRPRRGASCEDLAGSALISLGSQLEREANNSEQKCSRYHKDDWRCRSAPPAAPSAAGQTSKRSHPTHSNSSGQYNNYNKKKAK